MAFLPLHMENLYEPILGLSKDVVMGLPISVEFLFVGIAIFISGAWLDRRGWHEPFLCGLLLAAVGTFYSWLAQDALHFIFSRAILGIGYGLALMAAQGFVINYTDEKSKAQGLAYLFAGLYAGSICGNAVGAMLADRLGYSLVFFVSGLIIVTVFAYALLFMRSAFNKPATKQQDTLATSRSSKYINFITDRNVLSLIFLSSLPAAIAAIGFLNYFGPIYLDRSGVSESNIGRVLIIYGVCLVYIGPFISKFVDASENKKLYIFLGCILGSSAFLIFYFMSGLWAAIVSVFLLGVSNCFVLASQTVYALKLKVTRELGSGKAIGIFRATSRIGQMLGPIVFSWVILATDMEEGVIVLGLLYFIAALLFLLLTQRERGATAKDSY